MNPALSISLLTVRKVKFLQCIFLIFGQILGGFLGAGLVYLAYLKQFDEFDGGIRSATGINGTADVFFTMLAKGFPQWNAFVDQIVCTAILLIFIMAVTHKSNNLVSNTGKAFAYALIVTCIICAFSINAGAAINPVGNSNRYANLFVFLFIFQARDLGPRLFGVLIYGWEVFRLQNYFFWVPTVGPIVGATVGVWLYTGFSWLVEHYGQIHQKSISKEVLNMKEINSVEF